MILAGSAQEGEVCSHPRSTGSRLAANASIIPVTPYFCEYVPTDGWSTGETYAEPPPRTGCYSRYDSLISIATTPEIIPVI
jgi:hypothetical protein